MTELSRIGNTGRMLEMKQHSSQAFLSRVFKNTKGRVDKEARKKTLEQAEAEKKILKKKRKKAKTVKKARRKNK
jgi:hypothetical protein